MPLTLSDYKTAKVRGNVGQKVRFDVGNETGVLFQHVQHTVDLEGHKQKANFTEGWPATKGRFKPEPIDYFLLPVDFREVDGTVHIDARMFFVPTDRPAVLLKAAGLSKGGVDIAGTLPSRRGQIPKRLRPDGQSIHRRWTATWKATTFKKDFANAVSYKHKTKVTK